MLDRDRLSDDADAYIGNESLGIAIRSYEDWITIDFFDDYDYHGMDIKIEDFKKFWLEIGEKMNWHTPIMGEEGWEKLNEKTKEIHFGDQDELYVPIMEDEY